VADNEEECQKIEEVLTQLTGNCRPIELLRVHSQLDFTGESAVDLDQLSIQAFFDETLMLGDNEQDIVRRQAKVLSRYYRSIAVKIGLKDIDLFILNGDVRIYQVLIEFLRQNQSKYLYTPVVLLASGSFNYSHMRELSRNGVKVLYQDQFRKDNPDELSQTFKTLFSIF
jgi:hypothetical protein